MEQVQSFLPHLVHVGALLYLVCFLFRNQILLRCFAILGDLAYVTYYFNAAEKPLWEAIYWNIPNVLINVVMIFIILKESSVRNLGDDELRLYGKLPGMAPADFRRLVSLGSWHTAAGDTVLAREGEALDRIYYVIDGAPVVEKTGRSFPLAEGVFIGEIAFLKRCPATATVTVGKDARYMAWKHADLEKAQAKNDSFRQSLAAILNTDLAGKLARA
jgi:Cyclic nucleotide-binding domain